MVASTNKEVPMSQFSDRDLSKSDEQKRQEIALFRYGLISPVIHGAFEGSAIDYFRRITREPLEIPHIGPRQVAASTVKSWLYLYRHGGLEALMPKTRCDSGSARVITDTIDRRLRELIAQAPRISSGRARDLMVQEGLITQEESVRNHLEALHKDSGPASTGQGSRCSKIVCQTPCQRAVDHGFHARPQDQETQDLPGRHHR